MVLFSKLCSRTMHFFKWESLLGVGLALPLLGSSGRKGHIYEKSDQVIARGWGVFLQMPRVSFNNGVFPGTSGHWQLGSYDHLPDCCSL